MCRFKSWFQDEGGYVIQCEDCRHFQVSFGTTMLTLDEHQFQHFNCLVQSKKECHVLMQDPDCKCIILPTTSELVHIIVSEREFAHISDMLQVVDTEMKAEALIKLFAAPDR